MDKEESPQEILKENKKKLILVESIKQTELTNEHLRTTIKNLLNQGLSKVEILDIINNYIKIKKEDKISLSFIIVIN